MLFIINILDSEKAVNQIRRSTYLLLLDHQALTPHLLQEEAPPTQRCLNGASLRARQMIQGV